MDLHMPVRECIIIIAAMLRVLTFPVVGGEGAARYIKGTNGNNSSTPIIAISAYGGAGADASNLFAASLAKPVQKADLLTVMRQLGFKTSTAHGPGTTKLTACATVPCP